ncbi:MAG: TAT-variant-translocated molybdopterin oxidoreductase [Armatimonadetes bacterium]|nr:TAT-variant-translocated molybdopterin oxidoreductase [Armatimonadota bacterium]
MNEQHEPKVGIAAIREKLAGKKGPEYWRSLEQVAETEEFNQWLEDEFPNRSSLMSLDRRSLLKFMGASMALAGLTGCRSAFLPNARMVPYVNRPEEMVETDRLSFATTYTLSGISSGVVVESHAGRPTKIEGNPLHHASGGASSVLIQGSLLNLYDPDRSQAPRKEGLQAGWGEFFTEAREMLAPGGKCAGGKGVLVLTESVGSPFYQAAIDKFLAKYPQANWVSWEPINRDLVYKGTEIAFGKRLEPVYSVSGAKIVITVDADILGSGTDSMRFAKEWASTRNVDADQNNMSRTYALECTPTVTGAVADHRMAVGTTEIEKFVRAIAGVVGVPVPPAEPSGELAAVWMQAISLDIQENPGKCVIIPGEFVSAEVQAMCHAINSKIGAVGKFVKLYSPAIAKAGDQGQGLSSAVGALNSGAVEMLLILGGNPAYSAPADLKFGDALKKAGFTAHLSSHFDETSGITTWHLPQSHSLEAWGDGKSTDGSLALQQPLIDPLFDSRSESSMLRALAGDAKDDYDALVAFYKGKGLSGAAFREALNTGVIPNSAQTPVVMSANISGKIAEISPSNGIELVLRPDYALYDGRNANNGWMMELPRPLTTLTWDNVVMISPKMAESLGVKQSGDEVEVSTKSGKVKGAAWIMPGQAEKTVTIHFGYGRSIPAALICDGAGFSAYPLSSSKSPYYADGVTLARTGGSIALAATQTHFALEGRDIIRESFLNDYLNGHEEHVAHHKDISMYPDNDEIAPWSGPKWGMTIDLNVCTSCHACVTACQSENNIPVVGKDQVIKGREMHWIRIDRYYGPKEASYLAGKGPDLDNPSTHFMPVACFHCEKAPCEPVCPVAATVHSHEGLNQMVYNRCVGTRYCSNNCPYKVRRFNFLNYNDRKFSDFNPLDGDRSSRDLRVKLMVHNPDVTVRGRGVMEKCTYCVQRINEARQHAKVEFSKGMREKPEANDGEIVTACQQACPTGAIVFGNIADPSSVVSRKKALKRNYSLLEELNTRNRTTYLKKIRNPHRLLDDVGGMNRPSLGVMN